MTLGNTATANTGKDFIKLLLCGTPWQKQRTKHLSTIWWRQLGGSGQREGRKERVNTKWVRYIDFWWSILIDPLGGMPAHTPISPPGFPPLIFVMYNFTVSLSRVLSFPFSSENTITSVCFIQMLTLNLKMNKQQ